MRGGFPAIPNFTDPTWQALHSDPHLVASILDGKGSQMPAFNGRISIAGAHNLVASIRAWNPAPPQPTASKLTDFEMRFRGLEQQFNDLERQQYELTHPRQKP
jgi:mono/diheme cytochrome c family protein